MSSSTRRAPAILSCLFLAVCLAPLAGCGQEEEAERETLEPSPLPVTAAVAARDTLFEVIDGTGRIASVREQDLVSQIQGQVVQAPEREGQAVREGEVLFRIASGEQAALLDRAYNQYRSAEALYEFELENYLGDLTDEVSSMMRRTSGLQDAEVALAQARTQYSNAAVTAGFDGVVSEIAVRQGVRVYPGTRLGAVIDADDLLLELDLDERQLALCSPGERVYVTLPSLGDTVVVGSVRSVSPVVDPAMRAGLVTVEIPGMPNLRPGATATAEIVIATYPDQLVIPEEAVLIRDNREMVFVIGEDGKANWCYVTVGARGRGLVSVIDGVEESAQVITSGHYSLAHEAPVAVVN
ncbi:efflux RND transporter periplasmic adaptor subunit [Candidatus Fermentibacterales bacterium]|nr:efflux RND transporter periplasmic adaptor subunit [Candidatus Fermentibacterales bacterium]